jgi:DDE superfamily endonuclease
MANLLLAKRGSSTFQPTGEKWVYNFIKRHNQLKTRFSRRYDYQRAKNEDIKVIQGWFTLVQETIQQYGILSDDIYNFDETGFAMGLIATAKVVTRAEFYGRRSLLQPGNREWVTAIESINANGFALPPCIIFKGKTYCEGWFENLPNSWRFEVSQNGWTTDEISLRWLQNLFIPFTESRTKGKYRLLILDGHGSHLTPQFDQTCEENNIIPICMPPHSSHLLQPLDVGCFSVLKRAYGQLIENQARLGINHIDKLDFLAAYPQARESAYKAETIQNSFAATGLVPYNPERVLEKLNIQLRTPTPPSSRGSDSVPKTPQNIKQLERQASSIKALLKRRSRSPPSPTDAALNQLIKGCQLAMNSAVILAKENSDLRAANEKQKQKRAKSARRIASEQGLSVQQAHELISRPNQASEAQSTIPIEATQPASQPISRAPSRCSNCNELGHRRTRCPKPISG